MSYLIKDTTKQEGWIKQVQTNEEIGTQYVDNFSDATEFITDDELVEVTPKSLRLRKKILNNKDRERAARQSANS